MEKPEIIGSLRSSYTRAVCMACLEKGVPYTLTQSLLGGPEVLAINPFGKMPVLRHGDFELYESVAIAVYLDRVFTGPALFPSDPRQLARALQWICVVNSLLYGTFRSYLLAVIAPQTADGAPDLAAIEALKPPLQLQLSVLDGALTANHYLAGESLSFADLNLVTILHNLRLLPGGPEMLAGTAHLMRYHDRLAARDSYRTTLPPPGPPRRAA
ncbi:MAG TPA: glutathione S-transferase family protein [Steroidobacteraceae bacterium]|jgi:glutathione S-transferase|nr:glutathione S-transferase family protein [Steroidobacteraceae bacterium]